MHDLFVRFAFRGDDVPALRSQLLHGLLADLFERENHVRRKGEVDNLPGERLHHVGGRGDDLQASGGRNGLKEVPDARGRGLRGR